MQGALNGLAECRDQWQKEMAGLRKKLVLANVRISELEKEDRDFGRLRKRLEDILLDRQRLEQKIMEWSRLYDELACEYNRLVRALSDDEYKRLYPNGL